MSISPLVQLYRSLQNPSYSEGVFKGEAEYEMVKDIISDVVKTDARIVELLVDEQEVEAGSLPVSGRTIWVEVRPAARSSNTFHKDLPALLSADPKIGRGEMPEDFYLIEENYYSNDDDINEELSKLSIVCSLIKRLAILAHYHDKKTKSNFLRLVFMNPDEISRGQPVIVETRLSLSTVKEINHLPIEKLDGLVGVSEINDQHHMERVGVFRNSISDFLKTIPEENRFDYLLKNWTDFLKIYDQNLAVYLSGFAFHKAKKEVAEAELDISSKISKVVGDITGKLLSVPVSLLAVVAVAKSDSWIESSIIVLGLLLASIIIFELVANQQRQLRSVVHSKDVVLSAFEGRKDTYPEELRTALNGMTFNLSNDVKKLRHLLWGFRIICWAPTFLALIVHVFKYSNWL